MDINEKTIMRTDSEDAISSAEPLDADQRRGLKTGDRIRIVTPAGVEVIGSIEALAGAHHNSGKDLIVDGRQFMVSQHKIFMANSDAVDRPFDVVVLKDEAVLDIIADLGDNGPDREGEPSVRAVSVREIAFRALGFDPSVGKPGVDYGGKTIDGWINQFLSTTKLRRSLDRLVDEGVLTKVKEGSRFDSDKKDSPYVSFRSLRAGWVTKNSYDVSVSVVKAHRNAVAIAHLAHQAERTVAARHQEEVAAELARLIELAGL